MSKTLRKVKAVQDEDRHWYVIPEELEQFFLVDMYDDKMIESGEFDAKWRKYMTGGDLNLVQLWAEI